MNWTKQLLHRHYTIHLLDYILFLFGIICIQEKTVIMILDKTGHHLNLKVYFFLPGA